MPSLRESFSMARRAGAVAAHGVAGLARVAAGRGLVRDNPLVKERLAICAACPSLTGGRCGKLLAALKPGAKTCGCWVRMKARLPGEHCPDGKWLSVV